MVLFIKTNSRMELQNTIASFQVVYSTGLGIRTVTINVRRRLKSICP